MSASTARLAWLSARQVQAIEAKCGVRFVGDAAQEGAYGMNLLRQVQNDERETREAVEDAILATREAQS